VNFESLVHNPIAIYLAVIAFASLLYALPKPGPQSSWIYVWLYRLLHVLGANLDRVKDSIKAVSGIDLQLEVADLTPSRLPTFSDELAGLEASAKDLRTTDPEVVPRK
jgi:hypothetical protein